MVCPTFIQLNMSFLIVDGLSCLATKDRLLRPEVLPGIWLHPNSILTLLDDKSGPLVLRMEGHLISHLILIEDLSDLVFIYTHIIED